MLLHQGDKFWMLWDDYTWTAHSLYYDHEGVNDVVGASPGFGSVANSMLDLQNVDEGVPETDWAGLQRSRDPGAGAFSPYYNRISTAKTPISAGDELFVSYGENWFHTREKSMGPIPLKPDVERAEKLVEKFKGLQETFHELSEDVFSDFWTAFVTNSPYLKKSRTLNAFPRTWDEMVEMLQDGVLETRKKDKRKPLEWLREHGTCADHTKVGRSTLPQAGHGAFAARYLPKGTVVAPIPLIHISSKDFLMMYEIERDEEGHNYPVEDQPTQMQLLLNYCMGHAESSLLLCPYGIHNGLVNHNRTQANVKLQWADPKKSSHDPKCMKWPVSSLQRKYSACLAMEYVATRDIHPGDELFLDYGQEWEDAWNRHVAEWKPVEGAESYRTADWFNADHRTILRTEFEEMARPFYPRNVFMQCDSSFHKSPYYDEYFPDRIPEYLELYGGEGLRLCDLLRWGIDEVGDIRYTALVTEDGEWNDHSVTKMEGVPRQAMRFVDRPYTSDLHLPNAFRHEIMIPDEIFPDKWKNRRKKEDS
jgi:hypothetical protein